MTYNGVTELPDGHPIFYKESALELQTTRKKRPVLPYLLILPTFIFVTIFTVWPVLLSIYQSFFRQRMNIARFRIPTFIGFGNYIDLFSDPYFIKGHHQYPLLSDRHRTDQHWAWIPVCSAG